MAEVTILSCQVSLQDHKALQALAREQDRSMSWLVRQGITHVLASKRAVTPGEKDDGSKAVARPGASRDPG
jgi:predicted transcriptional regulator